MYANDCLRWLSHDWPSDSTRNVGLDRRGAATLHDSRHTASMGWRPISLIHDVDHSYSHG